MHLISDIIHLYVINCSLKFWNFCEIHTASTCLKRVSTYAPPGDQLSLCVVSVVK